MPESGRKVECVVSAPGGCERLHVQTDQHLRSWFGLRCGDGGPEGRIDVPRPERALHQEHIDLTAHFVEGDAAGDECRHIVELGKCPPAPERPDVREVVERADGVVVGDTACNCEAIVSSLDVEFARLES